MYSVVIAGIYGQAHSMNDKFYHQYISICLHHHESSKVSGIFKQYPTNIFIYFRFEAKVALNLSDITVAKSRYLAINKSVTDAF